MLDSSLKQKAQTLRSQGKSYSEIMTRIPVSKSTISLWCRHIALTKEQKKRLSEKRPKGINGVRKIQENFWRKRISAFQQGKNRSPSTSKEIRFIAGSIMYWAEGTKEKHAAITNSDPRVIEFMINWLQEFFHIAPNQLSAHLHIHTGQNEADMKKYWSNLTGIPIENFHKSYIKPKSNGQRKKKLYHGTIRIRVKKQGSTYILFQILGTVAGFVENTLGKEGAPEDWMKKPKYA